MWNFHDFSVTQILREITFGESTTSKTAVFAISGALNFDCWKNLTLENVKSSPKFQNSELLKWSKWQLFRLQNHQI